MYWTKNDLHWLVLIWPLYILLVKSSPCQNTVMNTDPFSSIMAAAVTITTSFAASNSSRDTVTENIYSVDDTIRNLLPKQWVLAWLLISTVLFYTIPPSCLVELFEETWWFMVVIFWYAHTWNTDIVVILDRKCFWTYWSTNWDIIVSGNSINSYFPSHPWNLNLDGNNIITGLGSVEFCNSYLCDIHIHVWSIVSSISVSTFPPLLILCLLLTSWIVLDHF